MEKSQIQSCEGKSAGVAKRPRELISHPDPLRYIYDSQLLHRCTPYAWALLVLTCPIPQSSFELVRRRRSWLVREESRMVGRIRTERVADELTVAQAKAQLPSARVKQGDPDGPLYN